MADQHQPHNAPSVHICADEAPPLDVSADAGGLAWINAYSAILAGERLEIADLVLPVERDGLPVWHQDLHRTLEVQWDPYGDLLEGAELLDASPSPLLEAIIDDMTRVIRRPSCPQTASNTPIAENSARRAQLDTVRTNLGDGGLGL